MDGAPAGAGARIRPGVRGARAVVDPDLLRSVLLMEAWASFTSRSGNTGVRGEGEGGERWGGRGVEGGVKRER